MQSRTEYDHLFKLVLIGDAAVGKSSLLLRYVDQHFDQSYVCTIGVDFKIKSLQVDDRLVKLQIWDTAGQQRFKPITSCYFRGSHGCLAVFDLTNKDTFNNLENWIQKYREINDIESGANIFIVGNKLDSEDRAVTREEGEKLAEKLGCIYAETSAKTGDNLEQVFYDISKQIAEKSEPEKLKNSDVVVKNPKGKTLIAGGIEKPVAKKRCCYRQ